MDAPPNRLIAVAGSVLAIGLGMAAFYVTARIVPGVTLQAGRSIPRILAILLIAGLASNLVLQLTDRARVRGLPRWASVFAGQAVLLVVVAIAAARLGVRYELGAFPTRVDGSLVAPLLVATLALSAASLLIDAGRDRFSRWTSRWLIPTVVAAEPLRLAVFAIFLLSGAAGLIYEVVWARQLVLVFGNTTQAVSAILTGYFGGLAIGSVVGGRIADRVRRPLRLYGALELTLVVVVLITPLLFRGLHQVYRAGYTTLADEPLALGLVRYVLALVALAPATILMGATLPTLSRHMSRHRAELGSAFGRLYTINTIGAIVGTIAAGLVLIELLGLTGTLVVGVAGSAAAGLAALLVDRRTNAVGAPDQVLQAGDDPATSRPDASDDAIVPDHRGLALVVAFVSGLTSLGYQLLWTRLLASGSGNTTYVFTSILAVFLIGIAVGAAIVSRRMATLRAPVALLGLMQLVVAALVLAGLVVLSGLVDGPPFIVRVIVVVLPATLALGLTLPLASGLVGGSDHGIGRDAGLLLGSNTLGAIGGTFVVPFALIPTIGSSRTIVALALVNIALGVGLLVRERRAGARAGRRGERRRSAVPTTGWFGATAVGRAGSVGATILTVVAALILVLPNALIADPGENRLRHDSIFLGAAEDEIAAVQAGGAVGNRRLLVGGTGMTRVTVDAKMMAYLPLMIRPTSTRALVIAFGMGSAYRAALIAGLTVDGVELVPSVPSMFGFYYPDAAAVLANPRGHLIFTDGRNYVELSDQSYDIVIVDPPPPIESSGTSVLYSREFYAAASGRLRAGGVMMEWMPYGQSVDEFRSHVRTFADVFPHVLLAFGPRHEGVYMLGSADPVSLDDAQVRAVLDRPGVTDDLIATVDNLAPSAADWATVVEGLPWLRGAQVAAFAGNAPLIIDDKPRTEYFLLRRLLGGSSPRMKEPALRAATPSVAP